MKRYVKAYFVIAALLFGYKLCGGIADILRDKAIYAYMNSGFNPALEVYKSGRIQAGEMSPDEFSLAAEASNHITILRFIFLGLSLAGNVFVVGVIAFCVVKKGSIKHGNE